MDKKVRIYDLHDSNQIADEKDYWLSKSPEERLAAAEKLRHQFMQIKGIDVKQRLQRVLKITQSKKG
ncbi:MAG: hypothetical protein U5K72_20510 [Balneolaceae bacterium]|nr:hypothetical protein [Balneolaceae bacterium]